METSINKNKNVVATRDRMQAIAMELKKRFIGLDDIIDKIMPLVTAWYIFPEAQLRPITINMWGLTGSGKTALVKALVELLDHEDYFFNTPAYEEESVKIVRDCIQVAEQVLAHNKLLLLQISEYLTRNSKMELNLIEEFVKKYSTEEWVNEKGFIQPEEYYTFDKVVESQLSELESAKQFAHKVVSESLV